MDPTVAVDDPRADARRRLGQRLGDAGASLGALASAETIRDVRAAVDLPRRMSEQPYTTLLLALAGGYLLGGGLFTPVTRRALGLGVQLAVRAAILPMLGESLLGLFNNAAQPNPASGAGPKSA